ncbi:MAG: PDZ domain-containing protein [Pirellulaceae bacterium]
MYASFPKRYLKPGLLAALACAAPASVTQVHADEPQEKTATYSVVVDATEDGEKDEAHPAPKYWLGILLKEIEGDLATYLDSTQGVLVDRVSPESPAAAAGMKKGDILLKAGNTELSGPADLLKAVEAIEVNDGKPADLAITLLRKGKETEIQVTPAPRPENPEKVMRVTVDASAKADAEGDGQQSYSFAFSGDQPAEEVEALLEKLRNGKVSGKLNMLRMGNPSVFIVPDAEGDDGVGEFEVNVKKDVDGENLEVTVKRKDKEPATITITQDGETKDYSEEQVGEIPEKIRAIVVPLLKGGSVQWHSNDKRATITKLLGDAAVDVDKVVNAESMAKLVEQHQLTARKAAEEARKMAEAARIRALRAVEQSGRIAEQAKAHSQSEVDELRKLVENLQTELKELRKQLEKPE